MATTADFKNGLCLEYNNDLFTIVEFQHVKPGKGPAFVRTKLKSLTTGKVIENTFTAGHKITKMTWATILWMVTPLNKLLYKKTW